MSEVWTTRRMLDWMQPYLIQHGDENPLVSARWILSDATGLTATQLYLDMDRPLSSDELDAIRCNVKRRAGGEPLQYITGTAPFRHIELNVRPGVLIPRPETEVLVSEVLSRIPSYRYNVSDADSDFGNQEAAARIVDLCTGSGCIACSLAFEHPLVKVLATDISQDCVDLARENVEALGLSDRVEVLCCDLGEGVPDELDGMLDVVVSNPPYIPTDVLASLPVEVTSHEPTLALDGGSDGLEVFRRIVAWSLSVLKGGGFMAVELHETTLDNAAAYARAAGFADTDIVKDLAGKPRILVAYKGETL